MSLANGSTGESHPLGLDALDLGDIQDKLRNGALTSEVLVRVGMHSVRSLGSS